MITITQRAGLLISLFVLLFSCKPKQPSIPKITKEQREAARDYLIATTSDSIPDSLRYMIPMFRQVLKDDQMFRSVDDPELLNKNKTAQDSLDKKNRKIIRYFLNKHGYPGMKALGYAGHSAISMVIQHSPPSDFEYYYEQYRRAFKEKKLDAETLALFEER